MNTPDPPEHSSSANAEEANTALSEARAVALQATIQQANAPRSNPEPTPGLSKPTPEATPPVGPCGITTWAVNRGKGNLFGLKKAA